MRVFARPHAVERFVERVRPAMGLNDAGKELERLCSEHGVVVDRPDWIRESTNVGADLWLEIADGIAVAVAGTGRRLEAITVMTRCGMEDGARARKRRAQAAVRRGKAGKRYMSRRASAEQRGGPRREAPEVDEWL